MDNDIKLLPNDQLSWSFSEFNPEPRSGRWYFWFGTLAAVGIVYGVLFDNFLFSIIILLSALIIFLQSWRRPGRVQFVFTPDVIQVGERQYQTRDLVEFWIAYRPPQVKVLYLGFRSAWKPFLAIPLENTNPLQVREVLLQFLPENLEREDEPLADTLARSLKLQ